MDRAWRLLDDGSGEPAFNMAVDETLLERGRLHASRPALRIYAWDPPAVSLGRFQADAHIPEALRGFARIRRASGGGAILHRDEVTFAVAAPLDRLGGAGAGVEASFFAVNRALARALALLGVEVDQCAAPRPSAPPPGAGVPERAFRNSSEQGGSIPEQVFSNSRGQTGRIHEQPFSNSRDLGVSIPEQVFSNSRGLGVSIPEQVFSNSRGPASPPAPFLCFERRSRTDLTVRGAKLVGSAQRRSGRWALQHGSIPLGLEPEVEAARRPMTLARAAGRPISYEEAASALVRGFEEALGIRLERESPDEATRRREESRVRETVGVEAGAPS